MSGWLGTINYGVITANKVDRFLRDKLSPQFDCQPFCSELKELILFKHQEILY